MSRIYFSLIALLFVSCTTASTLQDALNQYKANLGYLHDSKNTNYPKSDSVFISVNKIPFDSILSVTTTDNFLLPLIIINYAKINLRVKIGQSSIIESYQDFFLESLKDECNRIGHFGITNQKTNDRIYTLDIYFDTCETLSDYKGSTIIAIGGSYVSETGYAAETNIHITTSLKRANIVVSEKKYSLKRSQPFLFGNNGTIEQLHEDVIANMVESLSLSTKKCIEDIITDTNNSLKK